MHSYVEQVPASEIPERCQDSKRPIRAVLSAFFLTALACVVLVVIAQDDSNDNIRSVLKPKFVDWKKEDAGSDDMNLHLRVADALAKADGMDEKSLIPVPESLLKEAQQAAEEQKSMPVEHERLKKLHLPASLEKMFQQAMDEQEVEKLTKEGDRKASSSDAQKRAQLKAAAQRKVAEERAKAQQSEKARALKLLSQVSQGAKSAKAASSKAAHQIMSNTATATKSISEVKHN
eukprot:CAMPEP_0113665596 /NCGR_PEP_ID=MMETSP0038_2-20120614/2391_1 /TAXON_ID=2898 /ORGANISM="Cryptomonas paramecium" /LENGTH=232 /DNA_ID=CAMNT_0000580963 /DNA_START=14 /DNA_END=712 /DNA_ORIENTATION=- /assembly_acc=CAM_ASM_000170